MTYLLFHGRHITHTAFQEQYLWEILSSPLSKLDLIGKQKFSKNDKITHIIFAVTSANKANSRFNPLPFHLRAIAIDRFFQPYRESLGLRQSIVGIPHFNPTKHYIDILLKEINEAEHLELLPTNTIIIASTPEVIDLYKKRGFTLLTAEYNIKKKIYTAPRPVDVIDRLAISDNYKHDPQINLITAKSTKKFWDDYPDVPKTIRSIWSEPLLTDSGSLTETRNYSAYAFGMAHPALLNLKYEDIKAGIVPGRIVDEGCADGALMTKITKDFPDSDVIGIEIASEFLARCHERQRAGEFGGSFVFFHQRNLMKPIFADNSIDTTICNSTTHEIWSYGKGETSLEQYLQYKFNQLKPGGHLVIRDVVGPENKNQEIYLRLNSADGNNKDIFKVPSEPAKSQKFIEQLSTEARFYLFSEWYLTDMRKQKRRGAKSKIKFREEIINKQKYFVIRLKDATEFISKKDYTDNFRSEMNEEFAFFSFSDWKKILQKIGFSIIENPNEALASSRVYTNDWVIDNRYKGKVELFRKQNGKLETITYPPTNMVIIARK